MVHHNYIALFGKKNLRAICYVKTVSFNSKFLSFKNTRTNLIVKMSRKAYSVSAYFVASFFTTVTRYFCLLQDTFVFLSHCKTIPLFFLKHM